MNSILRKLQTILIIIAFAFLATSCARVPSLSYNPWEVLTLPTETNIADIAFTGNPQRGWLVGSNSTLLETKDGGDTWQPKQLDLENKKNRLVSVSFSGEEGWVVGQPSILLHTDDGGTTWERIPLSEKLPGDPLLVTALESGRAEMATNVGAIYRTNDSGKTWKALVQDAVGVLRNIYRASDGKYVAVSSRGNFYSTWLPGETSWQGHNRNSSRRLQNMGFGKDGRMWMLARGGQLQFANPQDLDDWGDPIYPEYATSWGLLDLAYRTEEEIWVSGGSGTLARSIDGGKSWEKDVEIEDVPSNFYKIVFINPERGFIIGQRGVLLKYKGQAESARTAILTLAKKSVG